VTTGPSSGKNGASGYIPPLRYHILTRFYDPIVRLTTRESVFKRALLAQVTAVRPRSVLDLGCGTGTLTIALAKSCTFASVTGLDADAQALAIAQDKARRSGALVRFERGFSSSMPFPDGYFDRVVSSLFFHHLTPGEKAATLSEVRRVLRPDGELHIADWGKPANAVMRVAFLAVQLLDGFATTGDSVQGRLPEMIAASGLTDVLQTTAINTPLGTMALYKAARRE